ncbi:putative E3 ubiquitin-protein ligase HTD2 [Kappamyces sp. JEL0680]|nr:putative E3 ubiquitin-protein ligase HTD2 [Kappamyces sp. JEL0680]
MSHSHIDDLLHQVSSLQMGADKAYKSPGWGGEVQDMMARKDFAGGSWLSHPGVRSALAGTFSSLEKLMMAFRVESRNDVAVFHIPSFIKWFHTVDSFENGVTLVNAVDTLLDHIKHDLQTVDKKSCVGLLVVLYLPILQEPETSLMLLPKLSGLISNFTTAERFEFALIVQESIQSSTDDATERSNLFKIIVQIFQQYLSLEIFKTPDAEAAAVVNENIVAAVQTLSILAAINETNGFVPFHEFYNEAVEETLDLKDDYPKWKSSQGFSYCNYPFLLSTSTKGDVLKIESMIQMRHELQDSFFRAMFIGVNNPYLQLEIRRGHVIRDALFQLQSKSPHDLKKQLRVSFLDEDGIDEGGIQKGLFVTNASARTSWFSYWDQTAGAERDMLDEYNLLGKLIGLAFYNSVPLDINFAPALYKKILGVPLSIDDVAGLDADLGAGLKQLLAYEGDVEQDYSRTFSVDTITPLGKRGVFDLIPNGSEIPVTKDNRQDFVNKYLDFLLNSSVEDAFKAFQSGLMAIMDGSGISLFRPEELQELICGSPSLDFRVLETSTIYDGYEADAPIIRFFWEIVHEFSDEQKKQLLVFTTGSDRVPVGGLGKLQFVIAKNGGDSDRLPTSHTCFNALLLSEYASKEKLKERLLVALENRNCGFYLT